MQIVWASLLQLMQKQYCLVSLFGLRHNWRAAHTGAMPSSSGSLKRERSLPESLIIIGGPSPSCVGNSSGRSPCCVGDLSTGGCSVVNPLPGWGCNTGNLATDVWCCTGNATRGVVVSSGDSLTVVKFLKIIFLHQLIYALQKTLYCTTSHCCDVGINFCNWMVLQVAFATHLHALLYIECAMWHWGDIICQGLVDRKGQECSHCRQSQMGGGWGTWLSMCRYGGGVRKCVRAKSKREESMNSQHSRKRTERKNKLKNVQW